MAIELENITKRYRLKATGAGELKRFLLRMGGRPQPRLEHHALRDVSLSIAAGESVALVGRNGSGKSTLLRIISGTTRATQGRVCVAGRIGGVVDLGAGFHPDLTGFENIFLHGSLLGMSRAEIRSKLDRIVDFCELGTFLESPVRHYSWGMFLRLGFAVSVAADPEILIVDEALAVGDGYFQWKCLRQIEAMKREGRTLLFVSHVPDAAEALCTRAVWLDRGEVRADGPSGDVGEKYHEHLFGNLLESEPMNASADVAAFAPHTRIGTGEALIRDVRMRGPDGQPTRVLVSGEDAALTFTAVARRDLEQVAVGYTLELPGLGVALVYSDSHGCSWNLRQGETPIQVRIPRLPLRPGHYYLSVALGRPDPLKPTDPSARILYDCHLKLYTFTVVENSRSVSALGFSRRMLELPVQVQSGPL